MPIEIEELINALDYNQDTGIFRWKIIPTNKVKIGDIAGCNSRGYLVIRYKYELMFSHRIAWLFITGSWPKNDIDHINGVRNDNRKCNLREATRSENMQNIKRARKDNETQMIGVARRYKRYRAKITYYGKTIYLGNFDTPDAAHSAYLDAKRRIHTFNTL